MIEVREANSQEMKRNIKTVRKMTGGMGFDENMGKVNWAAIRRISNIGYKFMPKDKGTKFEKIKLGSIKAEITFPKQQSSENIIMYIHGGGFVSGSASSSRGYCSMLANYSGCRVIAVNYALAPEYAYPSGVNDCFEAYQEILRKYSQSKIALVGESAGANLCLVTTLKAIAERIQKPAGVIVHSPFVDFCGKLDRSQHEINDFTVKEGCLKPLREIYVGESKPENQEISPIYGDMKDFPPLRITCDSNETLYADSLALYNKCEQAGINVCLIEMRGTFHAFATIGTGTPETKQILIENMQFINECFAG